MPSGDVYLLEVGVGLRRLFVIWNRGYRKQCVIASDVNEALHIAVSTKHIKRASAYRRFEDVTDRALTSPAIDEFGSVETVQAALDGNRSGCYCLNNDGVWTVGGEVVTAGT